MSESGTVLLIDDDPATLHAHAEILRAQDGLRVFTAPGGIEGLAVARVHRPDLILSDLRMEDLDGFTLCRAIKKERLLDGTLFVILTGVQDAHAELDPAHGVDDLLVKPITAPELLAKVNSMLRLKRLYDQLRADKLEVERLHHTVEQRFDQLLSLLVQLVDLSVPGAAARGAEMARLAARMAERFDIPPVLRGDLEVAARLHEIGKIVLSRELPDGEGPEDVLEGDSWRYVVAAKQLLEQTEGLAAAAELIGAIFENWDGTGHPDRLRQGQIPLRSRVLRLLIEYGQLLDQGVNPVGVMEQLQNHAGTRFDPLAVAYLDAIVRASNENDWLETRVRIPIISLEEGMVLADDLCTSSGVKLLAKGARLNASQLDTIMRRHRSDPIVHGAWIERQSAGPSPAPRIPPAFDSCPRGRRSSAPISSFNRSESMTLSPDQRDRLLLLDRAHGVQELLRGLAHDLRNHLQVLTLASQLGDAGRTPDIDRRVEEAIEEINHGLELLGTWGRHDLDAKPDTSLGELVATAIHAASYQRNYPNVPITQAAVPECRVGLPAGIGLQLLLDLIANAKEASPSGIGVEIGFAQGPTTVAIEIADRGPGIDDAEPEPLASPRPAPSHAGLGRFAARWLAAAHGGSVEWRPRPGGGTVARVTLPLVPNVRG